MLDEAQVRAYADADFEVPHSHFMKLLQARLDDLPKSGLALDLGCGSGDISRRFAAAFPDWRLDAIDGSATMLAAARAMTPDTTPIRYAEIRLPASPPARYDMIFSNSLLHHLADPSVLWSTIRDWANHGCRVFVMDLLRPTDRETAELLVEQYAADEPCVLKNDFLHSLLAAYEVVEIAGQLREAELTLQVEVVSDRHVIAWGDVDEQVPGPHHRLSAGRRQQAARVDTRFHAGRRVTGCAGILCDAAQCILADHGRAVRRALRVALSATNRSSQVRPSCTVGRAQ